MAATHLIDFADQFEDTFTFSDGDLIDDAASREKAIAFVNRFQLLIALTTGVSIPELNALQEETVVLFCHSVSFTAYAKVCQTLHRDGRHNVLLLHSSSAASSTTSCGL